MSKEAGSIEALSPLLTLTLCSYSFYKMTILQFRGQSELGWDRKTEELSLFANNSAYEVSLALLPLPYAYSILYSILSVFLHTFVFMYLHVGWVCVCRS